ncbi:MAG TPA: hypothetical protein VG758_18890 [Hyphomicrobiaceae bacterium]|jgi:hypothetical protein|nr:hypothetical protein [Hyphomicrobiaceae bacterium]
MPQPDKLDVRAPGLFHGSATGYRGIRALVALFCLRVLMLPLLSWLIWWATSRFLGAS